MRQALGPGALGGPGGSGWRGRWEGGSAWGRHVNPRPFHFNVWQNSLQKKKRILEWVAILFSRGSSQSRDRNQVSCIAGRFLTIWAPRKAYNAVKIQHSVCQQIWKTLQWPQDWKRSVFITMPKKANAKECSNYYTIALISHASKVMLKILQSRLQQYMNV